ncbi:hypothetical protein B6N25_10785 [Sphingobacteriales bacterium TSM_CSS]|nr:hypothetical protein B6N25_10785 [Sphingobacteriales bacterium TSM_CSS]
MKSNTFKAITLYFYLLLFCSCRLFFDMDCNDNYKFYLPFTLYPAQDTFHINDTIWLHADFSDMLLDSNSLNYYKVENEYFESLFMIMSIDTVPEAIATPLFYVHVDTGQYDTTYFYYDFLYTENRYKLHMGFIPTRKGLYSLHQLAWSHQEVDFQKRCPGELMDVFFTLNAGAENNGYFLALSPDTAIQNLPSDYYKSHGYYFFYVVE